MHKTPSQVVSTNSHLSDPLGVRWANGAKNLESSLAKTASDRSLAPEEHLPLKRFDGVTPLRSDSVVLKLGGQILVPSVQNA